MLTRLTFGDDSEGQRLPPQLSERRLKLVALHHPSQYAGPVQDWELDRGFRLRVLTGDAFVLYLRSSQSQPPGDFLSKWALEGEESFLLLPAPSGQLAASLRRALDVLETEQWWPDTMLLMSDWSVKPAFAWRAGSDLKALLPAGLPSLVAWVFQEMPTERGADGLEYFTPEQTLYQLGRISRHVRRRCRWRRWLP